MDIIKISHALSSDKRLKILDILNEDDQSAVELYIKFKSKYDPKAHRETIYRDLELLQTSGLVTKRYDSTKKKLYYHLKTNNISFNLITRQVTGGM